MRTWHRVHQSIDGALDAVRHLTARLKSLSPIRRPHAPLAPLEGAVRGALRPIIPPAGFRETLRSNLSLAETHKATGLVVEYPRPYRALLLMSLTGGLLVAATALLVVLHSRPGRATR